MTRVTLPSDGAARLLPLPEFPPGRLELDPAPQCMLLMRSLSRKRVAPTPRKTNSDAEDDVPGDESRGHSSVGVQIGVPAGVKCGENMLMVGEEIRALMKVDANLFRNLLQVRGVG